MYLRMEALQKTLRKSVVDLHSVAITARPIFDFRNWNLRLLVFFLEHISNEF